MKTIFAAMVFAAFGAGAAMAGASTFQNTCSNIEFAYLGNDAGITATCLRADGTTNATNIAILGIGNDNGGLVMEGGGPSTFQQSCGAIQIQPKIDLVMLTANCRTVSGDFQETAIEIEWINNNDGVLEY